MTNDLFGVHTWGEMRDQPDIVLWQGQHNEEEHGGDFISEARDWAGELISAQTMMGKILVTILMI